MSPMGRCLACLTAGLPGVSSGTLLNHLRSDALDTAEQERLETLLTASPELRQAYVLREQLTSIFDTARSKADELRRLRLWRRRVEKSDLRCFDPFLKLLESRLDLIANYFISHQTSS